MTPTPFTLGHRGNSSLLARQPGLGRHLLVKVDPVAANP